MTPPAAPVQAFFLDGAPGQRFGLLHTPPSGQPVRGHLVYVHPFAEEMNASRRMASLQACAMAQAGFAVLQIDLKGCGDSAGHFEEASWDDWVDDVVLAQRWMRERWTGDAWLWGLRAGCLLAAQACRLDGRPAKLLLWQPVLSGKQHLQQFLRLQLAGDMVRGESGRGNTSHLAALLAQGEAVEVAGYTVSPTLAQGLAQADLQALPAGSHIVCLERGDDKAAAVSPALSNQLQHWQASGCHAQASVVPGAMFWQQQEAPDSPGWLACSVQSLGCDAQEAAS
jgi:exosortase A-associated hydrolase 2